MTNEGRGGGNDKEAGRQKVFILRCGTPAQLGRVVRNAIECLREKVADWAGCEQHNSDEQQNHSEAIQSRSRGMCRTGARQHMCTDRVEARPARRAELRVGDQRTMAVGTSAHSRQSYPMTTAMWTICSQKLRFLYQRNTT